MKNSASVHFTKEQVAYLISKTNANDAHEAVEIFAKLIKELEIDPLKMHVYLNRLMEKDKK